MGVMRRSSLAEFRWGIWCRHEEQVFVRVNLRDEILFEGGSFKGLCQRDCRDESRAFLPRRVDDATRAAAPGAPAEVTGEAAAERRGFSDVEQLHVTAENQIDVIALDMPSDQDTG
jgi:hypothetical protein